MIVHEESWIAKHDHEKFENRIQYFKKLVKIKNFILISSATISAFLSGDFIIKNYKMH